MQETEDLEDALAAALRASARREARELAERVRLLVALHEDTRPELRAFVHGEVAAVLHLAPVTAGQRLGQALAISELPALLSALEDGRLGAPHALALLGEVEHLELPLRQAVVEAVLTDDPHDERLDDHGLDSRTPGELRAAARRMALQLDEEAAEKRREAARRGSGARLSRDVDGMAALVVSGTATEMAQAHAALRARAAALPADDGLTQGQREVVALLQALGVGRAVRVQAVVECPVVRPAVLDVRMSAATALGLCDEPAELIGYGPIDADAARHLLPEADLVRACVAADTGEVLAVDPPLRARARQGLRRTLVQMAVSGAVEPDLTTDGYVPSTALGRLVDLRDVTSVFPGDSTPARRCDRDHRLAHPEGATSAENLQLLSRRWHRAKQAGWDPYRLRDGSVVWISPRGTAATRRPKRHPPPRLPPDARLPDEPPG